MINDNNEISQKSIYNETNRVKNNIKINIMKLYQELTYNQSYIAVEALEKFIVNILSNINLEMDEFTKYILKLAGVSGSNKIIEKKEFKIESNSELNIFTSKDIQEENKEITRNFQNEAYNYMNKDEQVENENVAKFLEYVAQISRISYNVSLKIMNLMKEKFTKFKKRKISFEDENINKEFSSWTKSLENKKAIFKEYENILIQKKIFEGNENNKGTEYLKGLYNDLSIMYFHCHIAFPLVKVDFKKEENFDSEKMIDFINRGKNRKVNFVILPALISNGSYLQNGKYWVFTFYKNTFKFNDMMNEVLNTLLDKENYDVGFFKKNLKITVICKIKDKKKFIDVKTNIDIPEDIKYEFVYYFFNKDGKINSKKKINKMHFEIENDLEIIKYEFKLNNETLISSKNIINEN